MMAGGWHGAWELDGQTKKAAFVDSGLFMNSGSPTWTRTRDLRINSPSLYRLSYQGNEAVL